VSVSGRCTFFLSYFHCDDDHVFLYWVLGILFAFLIYGYRILVMDAMNGNDFWKKVSFAY